MTSEENFADNVIKSFKNISKEIEKGSSEHDVRYRFVKYFVEEVLGYESKYIKWEKKRADLTIIDENDFAVMKIETKKPKVNINKPEHEEQAFKYEEEVTRYIGLTNFLQLKIWEIKRKERKLKVDIDFAKILEEKKSFDELSSDGKSQILFLNNLTKKVLFDPSKYEKFDETYARIDITHDAGFKKLLDRLNYIANTLLYGYTIKSFGEYKEGYGKYQEELLKAEREIKTNGKNHDLNHNLAKYKQKLDEKYERFKTFSGYDLWKEYSGKEGIPDEEIKEIFCKETIYVFLNKLLFLRICEDKGLLEKNISNGGIEELRGFLKKRFDQDVINKEILEIAFKSARGLYSHFYETGILDWFRTGDGELNELLNKVLWNFNQFDFEHVDRDILGNLYEKYLPGKERKKLGEFYTPTEVIDYILTSVGYTYSHDIETKDILDPSCGSGGFLVRSSRRLISRYLMKFGKTDKKELRNPKNWREIVNRLSPDEAKIILEAIKDHIYGLDINPFACHIAEMNLLFQTIDLYQKVREEYPDYKFDRFNIYRTDSLEKTAQKHLWDYNYAAFLEEQEEIDAIKQKKFDFVVGNPPWGGILKREKGTLLVERLKKDYTSASGKYDIYVLFIERGVEWLKNNGRFGFIVQNRFLRVDYGKKIREYLLKNVKIEKIVDFGDTKVFADATNYPAIIIFEKEIVDDHEFSYIEVKPNANKLHPDEVINHVKSYTPESKDYLTITTLSQRKLSKLSAWIPSQIFIDTKIRKIKNVVNLKDISEEIMEGVTFGGKGSDNIYILDQKTIDKYRIESDIYKKVLKGRDIRKWSIEWDKRFLFYPYDPYGREINLNEYPNGNEYLKNYEQSLSTRTLDGKNITKWGKKWFSYWRLRNPKAFIKQKILSPRLAIKNSFSLDENGDFYFTDSAVAILSEGFDPRYLLGLLNSKLLFFVVKNTSPFVQGRYYSYTRTYLEKLPIKIPKTSEEKKIANEIINKVDKINKLNKSLSISINEIIKDIETIKLCNTPKVKFSIDDNTRFEDMKKDGSKIFIDKSNFLEINDKKTLDYVSIYLQKSREALSKIDNIKSEIINIPIPKSTEIMDDIIKKGILDQKEISTNVINFEKELDRLVYDIYGLTNKDISVIEGKTD